VQRVLEVELRAEIEHVVLDQVEVGERPAAAVDHLEDQSHFTGVGDREQVHPELLGHAVVERLGPR
jgi:hypothetical protein